MIIYNSGPERNNHKIAKKTDDFVKSYTYQFIPYEKHWCL